NAMNTYSTGCGNDMTTTFTTIAAPAAITAATTNVCSGSSIALADATTGGVWSSSNTSVANVNSTGGVTGGIAGNAVITYSTGCGTDMTTTVTKIAAPAAITAATTNVCSGSSIALADA